MVSVGGGLWPQTIGGPAAGGSTDQAYVKASGADHDAAWASAPGGVPMAPIYQSGCWYDQRPNTSALSTASQTAGTCCFTPWYLPQGVTINALAAASSSGASTVYCAVSEYLSPAQPGRVLASMTTGVTSGGAAIGAITPLTLNAGWYFWAFGCASTMSPYGVLVYYLRNLLPMPLNPPSGALPASPASYACYLAETGHGGRPSDYPSVAPVASGTIAPVVPFRIG
jgi:hypothetical protein